MHVVVGALVAISFLISLAFAEKYYFAWKLAEINVKHWKTRFEIENRYSHGLRSVIDGYEKVLDEFCLPRLQKDSEEEPRNPNDPGEV